MDERDAYERRAARLALLLTGENERAAEALTEVLGAHPDLARVGETMIERAVVQAARRAGRAGAPMAIAGAPDDASALWRAAATLTGQPWESWILRELECEDEILVARAMDCSKSAIATVHLGPAVEHLRAAIAPADYDAALASLRAAAGALPIDAVLGAGRTARDRAIRRSRLVGALQLVLLFACCSLMVYVLVDLLNASKKERAAHDRADTFSNPIPDDEAQPNP